jgi:hypothetical protein
MPADHLSDQVLSAFYSALLRAEGRPTCVHLDAGMFEKGIRRAWKVTALGRRVYIGE